MLGVVVFIQIAGCLFVILVAVLCTDSFPPPSLCQHYPSSFLDLLRCPRPQAVLPVDVFFLFLCCGFCCYC